MKTTIRNFLASLFSKPTKPAKPTLIKDGKWRYLVIVKNKEGIEFYLDGVRAERAEMPENGGIWFKL